MNWAVTGIVYAVVYAAAVVALAERDQARLVVGNIGLLLPPLAPLAMLLVHRRRWSGRQAVFFAAIAGWAVLWFIGQVGWTIDQLFRGMPLPWFTWHVILQLCGSALPLIALVAAPHRGARRDTAITAAVDITVLTFLAGFLYWSLIIAPGMDQRHELTAVGALATIGPLVRLAATAGLVIAMFSAGKTGWGRVYQRLALGMIAAFVVLIGLSISTVNGTYRTGSLGDIGWMLPFWFAAWAIATAPASEPDLTGTLSIVPVGASPPLVLFAAILAVPLVGYGARFVMPLDPPIENLRATATAFTLVGSVALVMVRLVVERRALERANGRVRLLATAFENTAELIVVTSQQYIEFANQAFCDATGYTRDELRSLAVIDLVAEESRGTLSALRERLQERQVARSTSVIRRKDGTKFEAGWSAVTIDDGNGLHVVTVMRDLTEELRLREHLVRSERLSAVGELVSGVAHEVNNPLQSVLGTIELVLGEEHTATVRQDLELARHEAGRAARIIRNLLAFVRRSPVERLLADLNEVVHATVTVRAYELAQANIEVHEEYGANLPVVLTNRDDIQQVVLNLVMNAQHAMVCARGGGVLTVRTYVSGDQALLEVHDDGPGVPPGLQGRIFEPFFTTKVAGTGTGLGLSLSLGIAHAHGGELELVPTERGACFRLTLPGAGFPGPAPAHSTWRAPEPVVRP